MIGRLTLERHQIWLYLAAIGVGLWCGAAAPSAPFETLLWPALAALLYATFTQVPLVTLAPALSDRRFLAALLAANFAAVPALVALLLPAVPQDRAIRLGVVLVLTVPCTDWFITFTHLSGGDAARAIAATPILLLAQIAALPAMLWLLLGDGAGAALPAGRMVEAFAGLIALPLALAALTERAAQRSRPWAAAVRRLGAAPVPLLALVLLLIAAAQAGSLQSAASLLAAVLPAFVLYLLGALALGLATARIARLEPRAGRTVVFSLGTRNSFVVLPLALALPPGWEASALAIVVQSLVELFGMIAYLRVVPRLLPLR